MPRSAGLASDRVQAGREPVFVRLAYCGRQGLTTMDRMSTPRSAVSSPQLNCYCNSLARAVFALFKSFVAPARLMLSAKAFSALTLPSDATDTTPTNCFLA